MAKQAAHDRLPETGHTAPTNGLTRLRWTSTLAIVAIALWWLCLKAFTSRWVYLLQYGAVSVVSPKLEVLVPTPWPTLLFIGVGAGAWLYAAQRLFKKCSRAHPSAQPRLLVCFASGVAWLLLATAPWLFDLWLHLSMDVAMVQAVGIWGPTLWQPLWLAGFSGLAARSFALGLILSENSAASSAAELTSVRTQRLAGQTVFGGPALVAVLSLLCGAWWFAQSQQAFDNFLLGFNDCGHFAQRIANTAAGRGLLLESPVLPAFWDHFNPGLLVLVPLWWLWPHMSLLFAVQAVCLAGSAPILSLLARRLGASAVQANLWGIAWLMQPVLGQMNLAFGYGWHPISLAIPALLATLVCVVSRRWWWAAGWSVVACSMEEGALVIIATTSASLAAIELVADRNRWLSLLRVRPGLVSPEPALDGVRRVSALLPAPTWIAIAALATVSFVLIYKFSGLAPFQTGRFVSLGNTPLEILTSPVTRPEAFWGLLLRSRNAIFLAGLLIPCGLWSLARGWPLLLPLVLPLAVLFVWNHTPAQSLAFHYSSTLLPVLWLSAIVGANRYVGAIGTRASGSGDDEAYALSWSTLVTALVAGCLLGQMPWSVDTLNDMRAKTFDSSTARRSGTDDHRFAHQQLASIRQRGEGVLATGRLATHLVGVKDLETVGQFFERREALAKLTPDRHPLLRYETIVLDRLEGFQQSRSQIDAIEQEALANGFQIQAQQHDLIVLVHTAAQQN
ncbi:MAG: DUF2079 domain-containing protein [Pirellulaceae bacterium]|nr:DUF2079 domain-containing protein [Pirellulaceae bacterium]